MNKNFITNWQLSLLFTRPWLHSLLICEKNQSGLLTLFKADNSILLVIAQRNLRIHKARQEKISFNLNVEGEQNFLYGASVMCSEEIKDCDFVRFSNKDEKAKEGIRDEAAGTSMITMVKKCMEKIKQLEYKIRKLKNISKEHEKCQKLFADFEKLKD